MKIKILDKLLIRHNEIDHQRQSVWLLHGFGDSGLAYKEVFESALKEDFNLYVVDLPGFGVSPIHPDYLFLDQQAELLSKIILEETGHQKVNLIAHSLSALMATNICQILKDKINYYFNIEGNLTASDSYFSSKPLLFDTLDEFVASFEKEIFDASISDDRFSRYYCSLKFADPRAMKNWSISSQKYRVNNKCGHDFKALECKKIYIWGDIHTTDETQHFIQEHHLPNKLYQGIGHWHMVENPEILYQDISDLLKAM